MADAIPVAGAVSGEWLGGGFDTLPVQLPREPAPAAPAMPARLSIVLPFIEREVPQVLALLDWIRQLSGQMNRTLYLLPAKGLDPAAVRSRAGLAFADVQMMTDSEGVKSDWKKDEKIRNAAGPNSLFRQAAWTFYFKPRGPWLWLEPDCVPLTKDWADVLEADYRTAGQPFYGARMQWPNGDTYLNGAAIYPPDAVTLAPGLVARTMWTQHPELEIGFDVVGGKDVARRAHFTDLIQLDYRSDEEKELRAGAVLFHGDRAGKILESLSGVPVLTHGTEVGEQGDHSPSPARKASAKPRGGAVRSARQIHTLEAAGSNPAPATLSKRKRGDAKCAATAEVKTARTPTGATNKPPTRQSNGAGSVQPSLAPSFLTVGDEIRHYADCLARLATNANRKTRILSALRKRKLLRKTR